MTNDAVSEANSPANRTSRRATPDIPASRKRTPLAASSLCSARVDAGFAVLRSTMICPVRACASRPCGPRITDSITVLSGSDSMITSQSAASAARLPAGFAPLAGMRAGLASAPRTS